MSKLPTWDDQMESLKGVVDTLMETWRPDGATEAERQDMTKLALSILTDGYLCHVYTDDRRVVFMPLWNYACNQGGPNPDYVYKNVQIDPSGVYEISGFRGTSRFVEITQQARHMLSPSKVSDPRKDGPPLRDTIDLDEIEIEADGSFRMIISAERPAGHTGNWWHLDPRCHGLLMRLCACDWINEQDARVAINRLDDPGEDMTAEESARRFSEMRQWIEDMILFDMTLVRYYREHHGINVLLKSKWIEEGGGLAKQAYYDGIYLIDDDEALIVEMPIPESCFYWQILVADDRFATVDWVNRQSSLNDAQARVDSDGVARFVVSKQDPGVHNWLDKADWPWGILQSRFYKASSHPECTVTKVKVVDVRNHLPAETPVVTPAEREKLLRLRREGAQLRRIW